MAHFRGELKGNRRKVSRLGTKNSGLQLLAQTWMYDMQVCVHHDEATAQDHALVYLREHSTGQVVRSFSVNLSTGRLEK